MPHAPCVPILDPGCLFGPVVSGGISAATAGVANGVLSALAAGIRGGIGWIVAGSADWWIKIPSPNLASESAVAQLQQWLLPITGAVAVLSMIIAGARMAITRKANPLADVSSGLAIVAVTTAIGVLLPTLLLRAGDAWSSWVLNASSGGQFSQRLAAIMQMPGSPVAIVVVLGIIAIIIGAIQAILMLFRQASLIVLAGVLPLAAAGTLNPATRTWFRKVTSWGLALIFYKVAAAAVYATAFTLVGRGSGVRAILMGFAMLLLSLIVLPVLMKFFTWTTGAVAESASGGGFLQTAMGGAVAVGALRAYGSGGATGVSASNQARSVSDQLGPSSGPSGAGSAGGGTARAGYGPAVSGPDGPGSAAASPAPSAPGSVGVPSGAAGPGSAAGAGIAGAGSAGAAGGSGAGAAGAGTAAGAAAAGAAAAGPVGAVVAGLAAGAKSAGTAAAGAIQPPDGG